ncbi:MAG: hypothetical protein KR126chlam4_00639 [Candidatus Anoxychlamydiales bacterium]|uniref:PQ-loop repeat-containing protein n=1 Tax=marine sediment metagenome TaxID=412755 RepID=A0A0F9GHU8_9ZZZZ|nr:hypothetical protein [Candidatus Anoxychlamydiales bacterium]NGX40808.1 hypothetical protein [Candidatus Anoxychlamydiales bacterium]HEU64162.1 hypothetical protein [Chlamydiota bacterium]
MIFEMIMLICFGAAWPFSVYKSYKSKSIKGKSIAFSYVIFIGYIAGILHKIFHDYDWVIYLYIFNSILVFIDILLYYRNKKYKQP